jgi:hypothetical protein
MLIEAKEHKFSIPSRSYSLLWIVTLNQYAIWVASLAGAYAEWNMASLAKAL